MWLLISQVERKKKMEQYSHDVGMLVVVFDLQNETAFNIQPAIQQQSFRSYSHRGRGKNAGKKGFEV
jgi:hypothetical protein